MIEEFLGVLFLLLVMILAFAIFLGQRKSKQYRKQVMDFYVAAKTRTLAKADSLDLEAEESKFKSWAKKERTREKEFDLDDTIEEELKEKISEPTKKK